MEIDYNPVIQIPQTISQLLSEDQANQYEQIMKEMVEIENQVNFNKILVHYNLLESW